MRAAFRTAACAATAMGVVLTTPAMAQSSTDDAADSEAIVVTARRTEERLQDVPISITVFNQQQLDNRNVASTTDLATYTPSLTTNGRYGPDKTSFAIRGFSQDLNTQPTVGVYFAEAVAPRLSSNITSGNGAGPGSMFDLENVQVLKGPQGTLFGRNTTGGAILLVPKKPTDRLEGYVEGTYGNYNAKRVQAVLNVPLADTFKVRLGVDRYTRDGYLNNRSGVGPDDFSDINYWAARLSVLAELTPDLENYTIATYAHSHTNGTVPKVVYCDPTSRAIVRAAMCNQVAQQQAAGYGYYDVNNDVPRPFVKSNTWQVINTTTWQASDTITVKNIASYANANEAYSFSLDGDNIAYPFVITYPGQYVPQGDQYTWSEELQLQGNSADGRLKWQVGGYLEQSGPARGKRGQTQYTQIFSSCTDIYALRCSPLTIPFTIPGLGTIPIAVGQLGIARNVYYYHDKALYGQATYDITDKLSITGGIRYTWDWEKEISDNVKVVPSPTGVGRFSCSRAVTPTVTGPFMVNGGYCTRTFVQKSSKPTWLIDLDFKPTPDMLLFAKWARGYRGGGINEANVGAETWAPEYLDDYEIGYKASFRGAVSGNLAITGFWNEFRNAQTTVVIPQCTGATPGCTNPAPTGINGIFNVGRARIRGVEFDGSLIFGDLRLDVGYAYLDAKVTGGGVPVCDNTRFNCAAASYPTAGTRFLFAPKNRVTATATYTLPLDASIGEITLGATFTHTDSLYSSHSNDAAYAAGLIPFNAGLSPATNLLNLNANWKNVAGSPIDLALFATNVTKQKYYVATANGLATLGGEAVIPGEPRMYGVRLKVHFGD